MAASDHGTVPQAHIRSGSLYPAPLFSSDGPTTTTTTRSRAASISKSTSTSHLPGRSRSSSTLASHAAGSAAAGAAPRRLTTAGEQHPQTSYPYNSSHAQAPFLPRSSSHAARLPSSRSSGSLPSLAYGSTPATTGSSSATSSTFSSSSTSTFSPTFSTTSSIFSPTFSSATTSTYSAFSGVQFGERSSSISRERSNTVVSLAEITAPPVGNGLPNITRSNFRDSFMSIVEDPFFQKYHEAEKSPLPDLDDPSLYEYEPSPTTLSFRDREDHGSAIAVRWPPPRRESLTIEHSLFAARPAASAVVPPPTAESQTQIQTATTTHAGGIAPSPSPSPGRDLGMESLNIAVVGATGVGKSTFVQRVLNLSRLPLSNASSTREVVDNVSYGVTLLELDLEYFDMSPTHPIQWPKQINGHIVPRVDGALILYDVTNLGSIAELPQTLAALTNSGLPSVLVACKCDNPDAARQIDTHNMANHEVFKSCVATYNVSVNAPDSARACLKTILKAAVAARKEGEIAELSMSRRRAASAANLDVSDPINGRPLSQHSKHSRASSDLSLLRQYQQQNNLPDHHYRGQPSPRVPPYMATPPSAPSATFVASDGTDDGLQTVSSMLRTPGIRLDRTDSFLDIEESDAESYRYSDDIPILQRNDESYLEKPSKMAGVSFDDLVDRLLAPRMAKADGNFSDIFLCLYRKFAAPGELFSTILTRLDRVRDDKSQHYLSKTATQLRIIEVIAKWVATYPGDFARPATRKNLDEFIRHLSTEPVFSAAAQQMRRHLEFHVFEDDDTGWAKSDEMDDQLASRILSKDAAAVAAAARAGPQITSGMSSLHLDDDATLTSSMDRRASSAGSDASSRHDRGSSSLGGSQTQFQTFQSVEEYETEAATMEPTDQLPMNKFRYHIFMDTPDDDLADEITRIDWVMFSSIRIRDFVRHVSLPPDQKEQCRSLKNVERMISHFNHVAHWVANMILLRDKAKHRALMLEKFMLIALKLRQLNNYNGLAAVLAGINGSAIHRLSQTRALVPAEVQKRFARLVILMGTQKSHFAYRLAWENSPLPRIPFIPLHRRDLISAEEGSRTLVGPNEDRINWRKFEVLGEVLLPIMKSQGTPYPNLSRHEIARELILDCRMPTDDEEIYQRSLEVEGGGASDPSKKKFPWWQKS